mmetsp:Transcript_51435/g.148437  ORF Transcript_51435/g.148437 Transcript_51435/m.148437 type:complete len:256 (+) Transcript_51435:292-1059(+)
MTCATSSGPVEGNCAPSRLRASFTCCKRFLGVGAAAAANKPSLPDKSRRSKGICFFVSWRSMIAVMKYPKERIDNKLSAKDRKERCGAAVINWQRSEQLSIVSRFCDKSKICREAQSPKACTKVVNTWSLMPAPLSKACCKSWCRIHWSITRMSFAGTSLQWSRSSLLSEPLPLLWLRATECSDVDGATPAVSSCNLRSKSCVSASSCSRRVTSSSSCRVSLTTFDLITSSSSDLCCSTSARIFAACRSAAIAAS